MRTSGSQRRIRARRERTADRPRTISHFGIQIAGRARGCSSAWLAGFCRRPIPFRRTLRQDRRPDGQGSNTPGRYQELAAGEPDHVAALKRDRRCQNGQLRFENGLAVPCREDAAGCGCGQRSGTKTRKWQYEPSETWSGRGKQPRGLIAALKTGHTIDEFVNRNVESNKNNFRRQRA